MPLHAPPHDGDEVVALALGGGEGLLQARGLAHPGEDEAEASQALVRPIQVDPGRSGHGGEMEVVEGGAHDPDRRPHLVRQPAPHLLQVRGLLPLPVRHRGHAAGEVADLVGGGGPRQQGQGVAPARLQALDAVAQTPHADGQPASEGEERPEPEESDAEDGPELLLEGVTTDAQEVRRRLPGEDDGPHLTPNPDRVRRREHERGRAGGGAPAGRGLAGQGLVHLVRFGRVALGPGLADHGAHHPGEPTLEPARPSAAPPGARPRPLRRQRAGVGQDVLPGVDDPDLRLRSGEALEQVAHLR